MTDFVLVAAALGNLMLIVWAVLKHRRNEVAEFPLSGTAWVIRLGMIALGVLLVLIAKGAVWLTFAGAALIGAPLFYRQLPAELARLVKWRTP